ncbi:L-threonine 3-O-phosphate decarboxylase [hydrothermal vent metagenome]|uniref:threonine-phosphate decarboxylase n=1 Tax=hydrothermal vent metagenome TaxID=652676 RepID=A0A3B0ZW45_9ZZZZ
MPFDNLVFNEDVNLPEKIIPKTRHGGDIVTFSKHYGVPVNQWLDLSTGLNPFAWSVPAIAQHIWEKLPQQNNQLETIACRYYGCENLLAVAGSQMAIQLLPALYQQYGSPQRGRVAILAPSYSEHQHAWQQAGYAVEAVCSDNINAIIADTDVLVIVNPNNPTGEPFAVEQLLAWREQLSEKGGWLIVDEAFMDLTPQNSLAQYAHLSHLVVLRSFGKFFGLAGIRLGFVLANNSLLNQLKALLGPWPVSAPAREIAQTALADIRWQANTIKQLQTLSKQLVCLLEAANLPISGQTGLFVWVKTPRAYNLFTAFAQQGILVRYFAATDNAVSSLRFGLPKMEKDWERLKQALDSVSMPE